MSPFDALMSEMKPIPLLIGTVLLLFLPGPAKAEAEVQAGTLAAWQERGATEIVINWVRPKMLHAVLDAAEDVAS